MRHLLSNRGGVDLLLVVSLRGLLSRGNAPVGAGAGAGAGAGPTGCPGTDQGFHEDDAAPVGVRSNGVGTFDGLLMEDGVPILKRCASSSALRSCFARDLSTSAHNRSFQVLGLPVFAFRRIAA